MVLQQMTADMSKVRQGYTGGMKIMNLTPTPHTPTPNIWGYTPYP